MDLTQFLSRDGVVIDLRAANKAQVLRELARRGAKLAGLDQEIVYKALMERERLGSTGIVRNVAVPHARIPGLKQFHGVFARLERPIDFESVDAQPVDLVFLLLAPENAPKDQLSALARISHLFREPATCEKLRRADTEAAVYDVIAATPKTAQGRG